MQGLDAPQLDLVRVIESLFAHHRSAGREQPTIGFTGCRKGDENVEDSVMVLIECSQLLDDLLKFPLLRTVIKYPARTFENLKSSLMVL